MKKRITALLSIVFLFLTACTTTIIEETENTPIEETPEVIMEENPPQEEIIIEEEVEVEESHNTFRDSPEIPSEAEMQELPDCEGLVFTQYPVDMNEIYEITPIGNLAPPGHTFPTDHSYLHINAGGESTETIPLYAPADVYIVSVYSVEGATNDPIDYTIYFSLCKDIIGYYNHVKELSTELEKLVKNVECEDYNQAESSACTKNLLQKVDAGTHLGKVGALQGNFDFGLIDLSKELDYINIKRYPTRSRYVHCAYDYYQEDMQQTFFDLIKREDTPRCGVIEQDIAGTLQGNWFHETAEEEYVVDWSTYLAFVHDNNNPDLSVISIAGKITDATKFEFSAKDSGTIDREFSQVTANGDIYCYNGEGKILVEMISDEQIQVEWQSGSCASTERFKDPEMYER